MGPDEGASHHVSINKAEKEKFLIQLDKLKILEWKDTYVNPGVRDGTQWSVRIILEKKELYKHGSNKYPKTWDAFCISVSILVDREFQ